MRKITIILSFLLLGFSTAYAQKDTSEYYGAGLCQLPDYVCIKAKGGDTWERLFPDARERDLVQRVNRFDTWLPPGKKLAVPKNLKETTIFDVSPFPKNIPAQGEKLIIIDQNKLAWSAYNPEGELVKWGPIASGRDYCRDVGRPCRTITGIFQIFHKRGHECRSNIFPIGRGGSHMPYCMFFYRGFAIHGSNQVPGYRISSGCVRIFTKDAKWLNQEFVDIITREGEPGTKVVVEQLIN